MKMESLMKIKEEWLVEDELKLLIEMTLDMEIELAKAVQHSESL